MLSAHVGGWGAGEPPGVSRAPAPVGPGPYLPRSEYPEPGCPEGDGMWAVSLGLVERAFWVGHGSRAAAGTPKGPPRQQDGLWVALGSAQDGVANRVGVSGVRCGQNLVVGLCGCLFPVSLMHPARAVDMSPTEGEVPLGM